MSHRRMTIFVLFLLILLLGFGLFFYQAEIDSRNFEYTQITQQITLTKQDNLRLEYFIATLSALTNLDTSARNMGFIEGSFYYVGSGRKK